MQFNWVGIDLRSTVDRHNEISKDGNVWDGYPWVSGSAGSGLGIVFYSQFSGSGPKTNQVRFRVWFSTRGYPMDIRNKSFGIKTHVL